MCKFYVNLTKNIVIFVVTSVCYSITSEAYALKNISKAKQIAYYRIDRHYPGWWYGPKRYITKGWGYTYRGTQCKKTCQITPQGKQLHCAHFCNY